MPAMKRRLAASAPATAHGKTATAAASSASSVKRARIKLPPDVPPVSISPSFSEIVTVIPQSASALVLGTGTLQDERKTVLLPYVDLRLAGVRLGSGEVDPEALKTIFTATVPLENLAFLLVDMMSDFRTLCQEIAELSRGELTVEPARLGHARYFIAHAQRQATQCLKILEDLTGGTEQPVAG